MKNLINRGIMKLFYIKLKTKILIILTLLFAFLSIPITIGLLENPTAGYYTSFSFLISPLIWICMFVITIISSGWNKKLFWLFLLFPIAFGPLIYGVLLSFMWMEGYGLYTADKFKAFILFPSIGLLLIAAGLLFLMYHQSLGIELRNFRFLKFIGLKRKIIENENKISQDIILIFGTILIILGSLIICYASNL